MLIITLVILMDSARVSSLKDGKNLSSLVEDGTLLPSPSPRRASTGGYSPLSGEKRSSFKTLFSHPCWGTSLIHPDIKSPPS